MWLSGKANMLKGANSPDTFRTFVSFYENLEKNGHKDLN